jgi:hypothetical protein
MNEKKDSSHIFNPMVSATHAGTVLHRARFEELFTAQAGIATPPASSRAILGYGHMTCCPAAEPPVWKVPFPSMKLTAMLPEP